MKSALNHRFEVLQNGLRQPYALTPTQLIAFDAYIPDFRQHGLGRKTLAKAFLKLRAKNTRSARAGRWLVARYGKVNFHIGCREFRGKDARLVRQWATSTAPAKLIARAAKKAKAR